MDIHNLVRMANRIGEFFAAMPVRQDALDGVAQHLRRYWEPRMRRAMLEHVDSVGPAGLHPLVADALVHKRAELI
jgi:formate dehydrogenase subunit delta